MIIPGLEVEVERVCTVLYCTVLYIVLSCVLLCFVLCFVLHAPARFRSRWVWMSAMSANVVG